MIKIGFLAFTLIAIAGCRNNINNIYVKTSGELSVDKVKVKSGFVSINRESDTELFSNSMKTVFNGNDKGNLETVFGENDFLLLYDDKYYYSFRHFIETDFIHDYPKGHDYNFAFFKRNDTIFCDVDIRGEIPMKFTRFMTEIKSAQNRLGNTLIEKAGTIFNMKEMGKK